MNCPDCGNPVEQDAKFCPKCYARIEPPSLLRRLVDKFQELSKSGSPVVKPEQSAKIITVFRSSNRRQYRSVEELPPDVQASLKRLQAAASPIEWRGKSVQVRAALVPRFLWSSASIDVYLNGEKIFRTGGKIQSVGSHTETVRFGGSEHQVELEWGRSSNFQFPYQLRIDGELVAESMVQVENQQLIFVPALVLIGFLFGIVIGVKLLLQFVIRYIEGT